MIQLFAYTFLFSQSLATEFTSWVVDQFEHPDSIFWVRSYEGLIDDEYPVLLSLGYNGEEYIGIYQMQGSDERFTVIGNETDQFIHLQEWDEEGATSGLWSIFAENNYLRGDWSSMKKDKSMSLYFEPILETEDWDWPDVTHWVKHYYGQFGGKLAELVLQKERLRVHGTLYLSRAKQSYFVDGSCADFDCYKLNMLVTDAKGQRIADMIGQLIQENVIHLTYKEVAKPLAYYSLSQRNYIPFSSDPQVDYTGIIDLIYPQEESLKSHYTRFYPSNTTIQVSEERHSSQRLNDIARGWQSIQWLNDRLISTTLFYQDSWSDSLRAYQLNYDLIKQEPVVISSLFKKRSDFEKIFATSIARYLNTLEEKNYVVSDFKHIGLIKEGFVVSTDFHPFYGQQKVIVPYKTFESEFGGSQQDIIQYLYKYK